MLLTDYMQLLCNYPFHIFARQGEVSQLYTSSLTVLLEEIVIQTHELLDSLIWTRRMRTDSLRITIFVDTLCSYPYIKAGILTVGLMYILYSLLLFVQEQPIVTGITPMPITRILNVNDSLPIWCSKCMWDSYESTMELQWKYI